MQKIQMVDLKRQYEKIKDVVDIAIHEVIDQTAFINGPQVQQFATQLANYLNVKYVIPCANGTDALQIALMSLNLQPGDEVITPSFTYIATVEVVALLGLKPVFVEVDPHTFNMDPTSLKAAITSKTKAIIPVHLYGQCANMEAILNIANEFNLPVIEDNAQAIGGSYTFSDGQTKKNGSMGTIGCTSFFPSKNLGCYGDGGAIFTDDENLYNQMKMIANHGQSQKYHHDVIGCNSRLDSIQAAILSIKLNQLDTYCDARRTAADFYNKAFEANQFITTPYCVDNVKHVYHQYTLILANNIDRDAVKDQLAARGIPSMIYYPIPSHKQKMFAGMELDTIDLPITEQLNKCVLSLPIHTELTLEELTYITTNVNEIVYNLA